MKETRSQDKISFFSKRDVWPVRVEPMERILPTTCCKMSHDRCPKGMGSYAENFIFGPMDGRGNCQTPLNSKGCHFTSLSPFVGGDADLINPSNDRWSSTPLDVFLLLGRGKQDQLAARLVCWGNKNISPQRLFGGAVYI